MGLSDYMTDVLTHKCRTLSLTKETYLSTEKTLSAVNVNDKGCMVIQFNFWILIVLRGTEAPYLLPPAFADLVA